MGFVLRVSIGMAIAASAVCVAGVVENYRLKSVYQNDSMPCCRHTIAQKIGKKLKQFKIYLSLVLLQFQLASTNEKVFYNGVLGQIKGNKISFVLKFEKVIGH